MYTTLVDPCLLSGSGVETLLEVRNTTRPAVFRETLPGSGNTGKSGMETFSDVGDSLGPEARGLDPIRRPA